MIKVLFFVHSMEGGGAERVVSRLVAHLDRGRFSPHLVLMEKKGPYLHQIPADVPIYELGVRETNPILLPKLLFRLRGVLKEVKPDLFFSALWYANVCAVVAARGLPIKTVISERIWTPYEIAERTQGKILRIIKKVFLRTFYPLADHVVAVSQGIAVELERNFGVRRERVTVIHNPAIDSETISRIEADQDPWTDKKGLRILSMGRLEMQKGHDVLIRALARLPGELTFELKILGDGPERKTLETLVQDLGLVHSVRLEGFQTNPYLYLRYADLFVLPSRAEGFPNALLEAMSFNLPVVASNCPTGPSEILQDGVVAPLFSVDDVEGLTRLIAKILRDSRWRAQLTENVRLRINDFAIGKITGCYEDLFLSILSRPHEKQIH